MQVLDLKRDFKIMDNKQENRKEKAMDTSSHVSQLPVPKKAEQQESMDTEDEFRDSQDALKFVRNYKMTLEEERTTNARIMKEWMMESTNSAAKWQVTNKTKFS